MAIPPPPAGYDLDEAPQSRSNGSSVPPPPAGYTLDAPPEKLPFNAYRLPSGEITYKGLNDPLGATGLVDDYLHRQSQYGHEGAQEVSRGVKHLSDLPAYAKTHDPLHTAHRAAEDLVQTGMGAFNYATAPFTAIPDSTVGRAVDVATGGAIPTRIAGLIAGLATPLGEERALAGSGKVFNALKGGEFNPMKLLKQFNVGADTLDKTKEAIAAADRVRRAQAVGAPKPKNLLDPASRAAARLAKTFKRSDVNDKVEAQRAAGIKPTTIGVLGPEAHRAGRAAAVVSPAAEAVAINERARARNEAVNTAIERIRQNAPHGDTPPDALLEQRREEQVAQSRKDYDAVPDVKIEAPDKVLQLAKSSDEFKGSLNELISRESEFVLQPEKFPNAEQHFEELKKLASYDEEKTNWEAAKDKFDKEKAAYDTEAKKLENESGKAAAKYEQDTKRAKAAHEKATSQWEARKAAHDKRSFSQDDFTGKIKTNDLAYLNKADVLNAKEGSGTAQVRDAMFETYGYKPRKPFDEPAPVLELPKKPKAVGDLTVPEDPGPPPPRPRLSPGAADFLKQRVVAQARQHFKDGKWDVGKAVSGHAEDVEAMLEGVEELAPARANFKKSAIQQELLKLNPDVVWSDPEQFAFEVKKLLKGEDMTPEMQADLTHNILWHLTDKASKSPAALIKLYDSFEVGGHFPKNLVTLLGEENAAKLTTAMKGITDELRGLNTITSGSKTAHNTQDTLSTLQDTMHVVSGAVHGNPVHAGFSAARMLQRFKERMTPAEGDEVMRFLTSYKTPEEAMAAMEALVKRNTIPPEAPPNIRKILTKAIAGQAASRLVPQGQFNNPAQK